MGIQCRIIRDDKGKVTYVEAPNGNRSKLYDDAIEKVGEEAALDIVLTAYTPSFTEEVKNPKRDAFRKQLINRIQTLPTTASTVTLNLEDLQYNLDLSTLEMVSEDLGNGETLMSFTAEMSTPQDGIAPNGKKSNLTPKQYAEVRTPEFMEWSNNWEDVIKDENGEPQVHYHGTSRPEFNEFSSPQGINFFTSSKGEASRYKGSRTGRLMEVYVKTTKNLNLDNGIPSFLETYIENNIDEIDTYLEDTYSSSPISDEADIYDYRNDELFIDEESWGKMNKVERAKAVLTETASDWQILEYPYILDLIKEQAYTSMNTKEGDGIIAIFNDNNNFIKSATDNRGTFNIGSSDIRYSKSTGATAPIDMVRNLVGTLRKSGLAKNVFILPETELQEVLENEGFARQSGARGFALGEAVYLNSDNISTDTPIHEFAHLWNSWMQKNAPEIYKQGIALMEGAGESNPYIKKVRATQPSLEGEALYEEALAQAIGDNGQLMVDSKEGKTLKDWLKKLWQYVSKQLGLAETSVEEFENLSLDEFAKRAAVDLLSGQSIDDLMKSETGTVGSTFDIRPDAPKVAQAPREEFGYGNVDFITDIERRSLAEVVEEYEGRVFIVTSDATGVGYDSNGDPIYGGVGYSAIKENVDGGVGFASLDPTVAMKTMGKIQAQFGKNQKVAILMMVQNPSATVGNYYGAKYFARGLKTIKEEDPTLFDLVVKSFEDYINKTATVKSEFKKQGIQVLNEQSKGKVSNQEAKSVGESIKEDLITLIKNVDKYSPSEFSKEFIKDTTFNARTAILQGLIIPTDNTTTDSSTNLLKVALKERGFNRMEFLKEYGDNTIFTEEMYEQDLGGFIVSGFEYQTPNSEEELRSMVNTTQGNGLTHPQFNGKLPTTGRRWFFDGMYPANDNFMAHAKPQTLIDYDYAGEAGIASLVQELYPKDSAYETKFTKKGKDYVKPSERSYTHLKSPKKIDFKAILGEMDANNLSYRDTNVAVEVARGMGFQINPEGGIEGLIRDAKADAYTKFDLTEFNNNLNLENQVRTLALKKKNETGGVTLNLDGSTYEGGGLVVPIASKNFKSTVKDFTPEVVREFIESQSDKINTDNFKVGFYKFPNESTISVDLNLVVEPKYRDAAIEFGKLAGQKALFDLDSFEDVNTGETGANPKEFTTEEVRSIASSLAEGQVPRFSLSENKTGQTQGFFSDVVTGKSDKFKAKREWQPLLNFTPKELKFKKTYDKFKGNFDNHIATSIPTFRETQIRVGEAIRSMLAPRPTVFNQELIDIRDEYISDKNIEQREPQYTAIDDSLFTEIAKYHTKVKDDRNNPTMVKSYRAFLNETKEQYQYLIDAGYTIEPWMGEGEPYGVDSQAVRDDVINNKHLYYLRSKSATGDNNDTDTAENYMPFESSGITINGDDVLMNDLFRAVHDIFGHVSASNSFSPQGELNAYKTHSVMYSEQAQKALFLETVVYNAAYRENGEYAPRKIYNIPIKFMKGISEKPLVYDIGGSEGGFVKTITAESNGAIKSINLDLNQDMQEAHNRVPVEGSEFVLEAFYEGYTDEETGVTYKKHVPSEKADVVHESMVFQFIAPERGAFVKEVKRNYLKEDGIALFEEKLSTENEEVWLENERKKNQYKGMYYSQEELTQKQEEVLVGMKDNQTYREEFRKVLEGEFKYVQEYWDAGNFKGYLATNSKRRKDQFISKIGGRITSEYSEDQSKPRFSVGFIQTKQQPEGTQVTLSNVDTGLQGQGVGTEMYKQAATQAVKNGSTLVSDFNSKGAEGIWSKFRQEGLTEPVEVDGKIVERIKTTPDSFDVNGEPSVTDVISYIQSKNYENETLSEAEVLEVQNAMIGTSMNSSDELYRALKRAFTPNGIYNPSEQSLVSSGVYSRVEARRLLDSEESQLAAYEMMHKLKNSDTIENNLEVDPDFITVTSSYNTLGTLKKANPFINEKVAREALGGIKDQALFYNQSEANDLEFANKKFSEISNLTKVTKMIVLNGTIRPETNLDKLRTRLGETLTSTDNESLGRNLDYALAIPNEVWNLEFKNVRVLLEAVEKDAIDIGLDLSSLNEEAYDKTPAEVKSLLNAVRNFVSLQNESTFEILLGEYVSFFDMNNSEQKVTLDLSQGTKDKTLVYSDTEFDSYSLFKDYGLLPLGNNLYQKVNNNKTLAQVQDIIYQTLQTGNNIIPKSAFKAEYDITNPENEVYVKEDISRYVDEQVRSIDNNANYDTDTLRKMVLFSKYFNTKLNNDRTIPSVVQEAAIITNYPSNAEYLKTEFVADFNKKMLKEKVKDSKAWKEFYKHFDISSKGIELLNTDPITMMEIQPYLSDDLVNHFRLKKDGVNLRPMEESDVVMSDVTLRNYYSNFPKALPLYKESYQIDNGTLVTNTNPNFIRVDEGIFEYVETVGNKALYSRLSINNTDYKTYSKGYSLPNLGEISKFNITAGVKANKKINHLYSKAKGNEITNEIDNC